MKEEVDKVDKLLEDEHRVQCTTCGKMIHAKDQQKHQEEHWDHICKRCGQQFPTSLKLARHVLCRHKTYPVKCPYESCQKIVNKAGYTAISCGRVGRGGNARFPTFRLDGYGPTDRPTDGQSLL